jgi:hypothetical protein
MYSLSSTFGGVSGHRKASAYRGQHSTAQHNTTLKNAKYIIHASSGIRTRDPNILAVNDLIAWVL